MPRKTEPDYRNIACRLYSELWDLCEGVGNVTASLEGDGTGNRRVVESGLRRINTLGGHAEQVIIVHAEALGVERSDIPWLRLGGGDDCVYAARRHARPRSHP